jgi:hypothetical protein
MNRTDLKPMLMQEIARRQSAFARAQARRPELAAQRDVWAVLAVLADPESDRYPDKERLLRAVLEDLALEPKFWTAVLMVAFHPALNNMRRRARWQGNAPEDLDQIVHEAFLEALVKVAREKPSKSALHLRAATEEGVKWQLRRLGRDPVIADPREVDALVAGSESPWGGRDADPVGSDEWDELHALLLEMARPKLDRETIDLVFNTFVKGQPLSTERGREYERLKRRRTRAVDQLEAVRKGLWERLEDREERRPLVDEPWEVDGE